MRATTGEPDLPEWLHLLHAELGIPAEYGRARGLRPQLEPPLDQLVEIDPGVERPIRLLRGASTAWSAMVTAARGDAVTLLPVSGFRSIERQADIVRAKLGMGIAISEILRVVAAPGYSEHHTGRAIDVGDPSEPPLEESFHDTPAFGWMTRHAAQFGFTLSYPRGNPARIVYEPWHWCWRADAF